MINSINDYIKYVNNTLIQYFKLLLDNKYNSSIVRTFINKYIDVRYYNITTKKYDKDLISRINKELNSLSKDLISDENNNEELIKNINALFAYVLYIDDCIECKNIDKLIDTLFIDTNIKIEFTNEQKASLKKLIKEFIRKKHKYLDLYKTNDFELEFTRLRYKIYKVDIINNIEISKLYSDYAINKAFNEGIALENKIYVTYIMLNNYILNNMIKGYYDDNYIVDYPVSMINKSKKNIKYFNALDNEYLKSKVSILFTYKDYKENENIINNFISNGYNLALYIDDSFKNDFSSLILFNYIIVSDDSIYYDSIMESRKDISAKIIVSR